MSLETVEAVFRDLESAPFVPPRFTVVWHAGEPLTVPVAFYRQAVKLSGSLKRIGCEVEHSIQTNGTLINNDWCEFFCESGVRIGLSLDGPAFLHDQHRKRYSGVGTHADVMRGARLLREHELDFHVICVLTRESLDYPDAIYDFFSQQHIRRIGFNIDEIEGVNASSSMQVSDAREHFTAFLERFYELSAEADFEIREFHSLRRLIYSGRYEAANTQTQPFSILSVDSDGNFSTFSPELLSMADDKFGGFIFGNIHQGPFMQMLDSPTFRGVHQDIRSGVSICRRTCEYYSLCGGGAPSNKLFENGRFDCSETLYCRLARKAVVDVVLPRIERELGLNEDAPATICA